MPRKGAYAPGPLLLAMPVHADSLAAWINRYIESMVVVGMQPMTAVNCRSQLSVFNAWCHERDLLRPSEITKPILERWQRYLFYYRKRNGQPMTMQHQVVLLHRVRGLFRWLARHNHIVANPASDLELPKAMPCSLPEVLTVEETEAILATFDTTQTSGLINRTMAEVLYSTAIRRTELASLGLYDIDLAHGVVHVRRGKGGKPRRVPIGERALLWVQKYLNEARPLLLGDRTQGAMFLNEKGEPLAPPTVACRMERAKRAAGIQKRGACHLFRHTAATLMLEHGADIRYIQEMLGHTNLTTTQIYTHVSIEKLKQIHAATHPGAKLQRKPTLASDTDGDAPAA